jgi:hypothetical protein
MAQIDEVEMPPRVLHLLGGLRVVDDRSPRATIQINAGAPLVKFPTPSYGQIYAVLARHKLTTIGVEFIDEDTFESRRAPNWKVGSPTDGFKLQDERRTWSQIRYAAQRDGNSEIEKAASRCSTYLDLLNIRLLHLSKAYNKSLNEWHAGGGSPGENLISNSFMPHIDAAIHAFVNDAGSLRDLVAEIVWRFVLHETVKITKFAPFLKRAKTATHPLVISLLSSGADGGWVKILSDLRDTIVHAAPMGSGQIFHSCTVQDIECSDGIRLPKLHYPLLAANGSIPANVEVLDDDEATYKAAVKAYAAFHQTSIDGLTYAWGTIEKFVLLLQAVRSAAAFRSEMPTLTSADLA